MYEKTFPNKRFKHTLEFLRKHISTSETILDLGVENPFSRGTSKLITKFKLLISIPLRLWFSSAYRSKTDMWDRHYHEFEDWQLDWLLEKTGWKIIAKEKFTHPVKKIGFRPLLRFFTPRYYIVYAEKIK